MLRIFRRDFIIKDFYLIHKNLFRLCKILEKCYLVIEKNIKMSRNEKINKKIHMNKVPLLWSFDYVWMKYMTFILLNWIS